MEITLKMQWYWGSDPALHATVLYNFDQFVGHGSQRVSDVPKYGRCHGSWRVTKGQILSNTARYDNFSLNSYIPYIKGLFWVQRRTATVDFMTNRPKRC